MQHDTKRGNRIDGNHQSSKPIMRTLLMWHDLLINQTSPIFTLVQSVPDNRWKHKTIIAIKQASPHPDAALILSVERYSTIHITSSNIDFNIFRIVAQKLHVIEKWTVYIYSSNKFCIANEHHNIIVTRRTWWQKRKQAFRSSLVSDNEYMYKR